MLYKTIKAASFYHLQFETDFVLEAQQKMGSCCPKPTHFIKITSQPLNVSCWDT